MLLTQWPGYTVCSIRMWRLVSNFFAGLLAASVLTNAVAVYWLHDVDPDLVGKWNLAYQQLTLEFLIFSVVVASSFLVLTWMGRIVFRLRQVTVNSRLGLFLGAATVFLQYPAEFAVRMFTTTHTSDTFLTAYLLLSPVCCAAIVLLDSHKRGPAIKAEGEHIASDNQGFLA